MDKEINNNGYDYVDLGLPSGTLWATMNVGASKVSDAGLYFQWGDTQGYTADQVGTGEGKKAFASDDSDYKFGVYPNYSKYTTAGATLDLEDDAAHVNMGGSWHIPTPEQFEELINTENTTSTWTTQGGVNGRLFTSKKDPSKSIFFPAAGIAWDGSVDGSGGYGHVLSSMLSMDDVKYGQYLYFHSGSVGLYGSGNRCDGLSVRGVIDKNNDISKEKKINMNDNLNLVEILKDAPKGTKLWSPICGELEFLYVRNSVKFPCIVCNNNSREWVFLSNGKFDSKGECVLFPSKDNMDWSTFKVPKKYKVFKPYQKVLVKAWVDSKTRRWVPINYGYYDASKNMHFLSNFTLVEDCGIIPYEGNEDKLGKVAGI